MVGSRLELIVRYVRQLRGGDEGAAPLAVAADLPDSDLRRLRRVIDDTIDRRGGEVAARRRARSIGATFSTLDLSGRRRFFELLARHYGHDDDAVDRAMDAVYRAADTKRRRAPRRSCAKRSSRGGSGCSAASPVWMAACPSSSPCGRTSSTTWPPTRSWRRWSRS